MREEAERLSASRSTGVPGNPIFGLLGWEAPGSRQSRFWIAGVGSTGVPAIPILDCWGGKNPEDGGLDMLLQDFSR
jgi:hypothetical protein